jgi:dephospho-CoA kinase
MILVGLTGGIGSGKSTVSAALAARGAIVIDADELVRDVQKPGSPVLRQLVRRFGSQIIAGDGTLDRGALAAIVFTDDDDPIKGNALDDLNGIVHPAVGAEMNRRVMEQVATDNVVVLDIPLLTESPRGGLQAIIVVDVPIETQVARLVQYRGFGEADARARIARQATRTQRLATADFVVHNTDSVESLRPQIDALWDSLNALPQLPPDFEFGGRSAESAENVDTNTRSAVESERDADD